MKFFTWIRNGKQSSERRCALYGSLRRKAVARRQPFQPRLEALEDRLLLSTYTVTSAADDGSAGTLRYAINQANMAGSSITEIDFGIGTVGSKETISLTSQLPALTANGVFINGLSQGGSGNTTRLITLDGTKAGSSSDGFQLQGSNDTVSGLIIQNFAGNGIEVAGATNIIGGTTAGAGNILSGNRKDGLLIDSGASSNKVLGNYIGINFGGTAQANSGNGVEIAGTGNTVGGTASGARNIVSGNSQDGVLIDSTGSGNLLLGNFIGVGVSGTNGVGNVANGIEILGFSNTIGGTAYGSRNILSANSQDGVLIDSGASSNQVLGNFIGTNASGTASVANVNGIEVKGTGNTLGGTVSGSSNLISGNSNDGVLLDSSASGNSVFGNNIGLNVSGNAAIANSNGIEVAGKNNTLGTSYGVSSNVFSGNSNDGVLIDSGASGNQILGNYIGTDHTGTTALANKIGIEDAGSSNTIGGGVLGDRNVISGNSGDGLQLDSTATAETIQNNAIGLNASETAALANGRDGVEVKGNNNLNGGNSLSNYFTRNFISGNGHDGVLIDVGATGNQVQGNFIGVAVSGTNGVGNAANGIEIQGSGDTIGGTTSGLGNVVSGNGIDGILVASMAANNLVQGNDVGTDYTGKVAIANSGNGVEIAATGNTVGGTASGARNIISGNSRDGVLIDSTASGNQVQGNFLGINSASAALGNGANGVEIAGSNNSIGGSVSGAGNTIGYNVSGGVLVPAGSGNTISRNSLFANGSANIGPGITLDSGANNNLAAPSLSSATLSGNSLTVQGTFNAATANVSYVLEFFASPSDDAEGKIYLGSLTVTPTSTGTQNFTFTTTTTVTGTDPLITATVTDPSGNTSAFPYTASGTVWLDRNGDGIENNGETGISGITVTLETEDSAGDVLNSTSTTTDANGNYSLPLPPTTSGSQYQIYVTTPSGYVATDEDASSLGTVSYIDPDGYSPVFASGGNVTINAGLDYSAAPVAPAASYSVIYNNILTVSAADGVLANDTDPNNLPLTASLVSGPSHGTLRLSSDGSFTYTPNTAYAGSDSFIYSAGDGTYNSYATVSLTVDSTFSGQVWLDANENGLEDNGESGMSGVTVDLVTPDGVTVASTTTDSDGNYLLPADPTLTSGYQIQVIAPDGYLPTLPLAYGGFGSDINHNGLSQVYNLTGYSGGVDVVVNAGLASSSAPLASISGKVWLDNNDDGILENGEIGLPSITVTLDLWDYDGFWNVVDVESATTDANGNYSFIGLVPAPSNNGYRYYYYQVYLDAPNGYAGAPNGYVFSPENVGSPATSSSFGPGGATNTIMFSSGPYNVTANAGLYGSAPIVYQTNVAMTAENDSYTGIDLTADGYDPNGEPLTPVIVQQPTYGSLVYDTSTGLYDYTAPIGYTGEDTFQYELSNGNAVSNVVTVQILDYTGILQPRAYDSFPDMDSALYTPTASVPQGNAPDPSSVKQGRIKDCWFVAAADGLAQQSPNQIVNMIKPDSTLVGYYDVTFPGHNTVYDTANTWGENYSTANGDWLKVLEKAYGRMIWNEKWFTWGNNPYDYINRGDFSNVGIEALTGHSTETDDFWCTRDSTTRTRLTNAFANNKVVVAGTGGSSLSAAQIKAMGLWPSHDYTVVAYNATTDQVRLRNPWGANPYFNNGTDPRFYLGKNQADGGNGYFWMSLSEFTKAFGDIAYEE